MKYDYEEYDNFLEMIKPSENDIYNHTMKRK